MSDLVIRDLGNLYEILCLNLIVTNVLKKKKKTKIKLKIMIHVLIFFNELKHKEGFIVNEVATNTKNICSGSSLLLKKKRSFCGKLFLPQIKKKKKFSCG